MQKYYKAEMDRLLKITTRVVWAAMAVFPVCITVLYWGTKALSRCHSCRHPVPLAIPAWAIPASALLVIILAYFTRALAPRGFIVNETDVVVDRALRPVKIPLSSITEVRRLDDAELKNTFRLAATWGFYGHYGWFWNKRLGKFLLYSGRLKDLVLLRTHTGVFVLGPEDTESFAADLRALTRR